jgi:aminoglycoside phosphotransferase (APT) family kinase protein
MNHDDLLAGRLGLEGLRWALKGQAPRRRLRRSLDQLLVSPAQLGDLTLTRAKYKPGRRLTAYYDVKLAVPDDSASPIRPVAVDWRSPGGEPSQSSRQDQVELLQAEAERFNLAYPFLRLETDLPDRSIHIQISPLDPVFPQLVRLSNPAYLGHRVETLEDVRKAPRISREAHGKVTPIRYRPGERHVLRFDRLETSEDSQSTYFVKLYSNSTEGPRRMRIAKRVADWLEECGSRLSGARAAGYLADDQAVLFPLISGAPLSDYLRQPTTQVMQQLSLAGQGLRALHDGPQSLTEDLERKAFAEEARVIARASEHVQVLLPETGARITEILALAGDLYTKLPQEPPVFTHSDFKADHLRVSNTGLTLFDFDTCSLADPALDVGKFLADLQWWYILYHQPGVEQAQNEVLSGYNFNGEDARLMRSRIYEALILLKITLRRVRLYDPNWAELTGRLVDCAGQILQGLAVDVLRIQWSKSGKML